MEDVTEIVGGKLTKEILKDGAKLIVIACKSGAGDWQLSVQNEHGITSNWLEFFPSSQLAIQAGVQAIEEEGVEPFMDIDGFEYLFDENV